MNEVKGAVASTARVGWGYVFFFERQVGFCIHTTAFGLDSIYLLTKMSKLGHFLGERPPRGGAEVC